MSKQIVNLIIIILISFALGFSAAKVTDKIFSQNYWQAAKEKLAKTESVAPAAADIKITSIGGVIERVEADRIVLKVYPSEWQTNPELEERIVIADENTKIYYVEQKDQAQFQKESDEFHKMMEEKAKNSEEISEPIMPPAMFSQDEINFSDIKAGQQMTVTAQENIKDIKEFKAIEIIVQILPVIEMGEPAIIE